VNEKLNVIIADDHVLFRQGLRRILEERADLRIVAEASDGLDLLRKVRRLMPDLIFLDISMPNLRGIEAMQEIRRIHPKVKILVVTMHADEEYLYQAVAVGVDGYVLKEDREEILFAAIESVRRGSRYVSPSLSGRTLEYSEGTVRADPPLSGLEPLTIREREVLKLIADGNSNKEIADLLCISIRTVERHRSNIMTKLKVKKTADLVRYAVRKHIN
jgi:DNA-binding NarL/FixJ family response regulator